MGNLQTTIKDNRVIKVNYVNQNDNHADNDSLIRYKNYLNKHGFYIININESQLKHKIKQLFNKYKVNVSKLPDAYKNIYQYLENNDINKENDDKISEIVLSVLELASTLGFFTILNDSNINQMLNIEKLTKLKIVIPKILFSKKNQDFFDFLLNYFINKNLNQVPENILDLIKNALPNILKQIFPHTGKKYSDANNYRFANILNLLFNFSLGLTIISISSNNKQLDNVGGKLLGELSYYIKDDECVNSTLIKSEIIDNNLVSVNSDICTKKKVDKCPTHPPCPSAPTCPVCPVCPAFPVFPVSPVSPTCPEQNLLPTPSPTPTLTLIPTPLLATQESKISVVQSFFIKYRLYIIIAAVLLILLIVYWIYSWIYGSTEESNTSDDY